MAQNPEASPAAAPPAQAGGSNKLVPIILVTNLVVMAAVLFVVLRRPSSPSAPHEPAPSAESSEPGATPGAGTPGPILKLENFVIQLRGVDQDRYVRLAFDIEVTTDPDREVVQKRLAQIRDAVISYFSDRTLDELRGSEGIERTKAALLKRLDEIVPGRRIRAIFITDFIIQ